MHEGTTDERQGFRDMAPLHGSEAELAMSRLRESRDWTRDLGRLISAERAEDVVRRWNGIGGVEAFQTDVVKPFLDHLMAHTTQGVTMEVSGEAEQAGMLFLSNHRDIVLDPSLVNVALMERGRSSTEIGIGSNLLGSEWIRDLVRLNRCFVVNREGSARERFHHSHRTASYIRHVISHNTPVWLAHREGRAKDGIDATAPALIRTLSDGCREDTWNDLRVVPVSISYEWDPCDAMKVNELLHRELNGQYNKRPGEDEMSMWAGLVGNKGRVHVHLAPVMEWQQGPSEVRPERWMADAFDAILTSNMKAWPNQRIAAERLNLDRDIAMLAPTPSSHDESVWSTRLQAIQQELEGRGWKVQDVERKWCEMLAAPLIHRHSLLHEMSHSNRASD